jgi:hypothetical protein
VRSARCMCRLRAARAASLSSSSSSSPTITCAAFSSSLSFSSLSCALRDVRLPPDRADVNGRCRNVLRTQYYPTHTPTRVPWCERSRQAIAALAAQLDDALGGGNRRLRCCALLRASSRHGCDRRRCCRPCVRHRLATLVRAHAIACWLMTDVISGRSHSRQQATSRCRSLVRVSLGLTS